MAQIQKKVDKEPLKKGQTPKPKGPPPPPPPKKSGTKAVERH